jgi:hypothetical protein
VSYTYKLTEEISRWAFEIHIKNKKNWWIAFTNPTAGPWKRIESFNTHKRKGEVYRFDRDEKRPDIVIVNDNIKSIIIFEAKDSLEKLKNQTQVAKSCQVIDDMAKILASIEDNPFWESRYSYNIFNGLLWGSTIPSDVNEVEGAFQTYSNELKKIKSIVDNSIQLGVESTKNSNGLISLKYHTNSDSEKMNEIIDSIK